MSDEEQKEFDDLKMKIYDCMEQLYIENQKLPKAERLPMVLFHVLQVPYSIMKI